MCRCVPIPHDYPGCLSRRIGIQPGAGECRTPAGARLARAGPRGDGTLRLILKDAAGAAVAGLSGQAQVGRPASDSEDRTLDIVETAPGIYGTEGPPLGRGRWKAVIEMRDGAGRRFRVEDELLVMR